MILGDKAGKTEYPAMTSAISGQGFAGKSSEK
jgi:hypothetical protein